MNGRTGFALWLVFSVVGAGVGGGTTASEVPSSHRHHHDHLRYEMDEAAASMIVPGVEQGASGKLEPGGRVVTYLSGEDPKPTKGTGAILRTATAAGEPTLGVDDDDNIFFQSLGGAPAVLRSADSGRTWTDVSPNIQGRKRHATSLDPFLHVDTSTGRVFTYDFLFGCSLLSFTDDKGETWTTSPLSCGLQDHQNLFTGPPVTSPTVGYPNIVYECSNQGGATIYAIATQCMKSLDGGISFVPTGDLPFVTGQQAESDLGVTGFCHGAVGHGSTGPDGTIYLPKGFCGQPWLAYSEDEGATWTRVQVADTGMALSPTGVFEHEAGAVADKDGNVYYFWIARDRMPYLAVSRDGGETWGTPIPIAPRGVKESALPGVAIGAKGKIAFVYMASTNSPGEPFFEADTCVPDLVSCFSELFFLGPPDPQSYEDVTWNGYLTVTADALSARPRFFTGTVNPPKDPMVRGSCGPIRCKAVYDFLDVVVDRSGRVYAAFVDVCVLDCAKQGPSNTGDEGVLGFLRGVPSLR